MRWIGGGIGFALTYGSLSDSEFVALLYVNVLCREPDVGGFDYGLGCFSRERSLVSKQCAAAQL